jgi:lactoylglutathione lyase
MRIDHLALWVTDLEQMKGFYTTYFGATSGEKYTNPAKQFTSYFLTFGADGARIELMHRPDIADSAGKRGMGLGMAHVAISVGSKAEVDQLTERLRADQYTVESEARTTGDGYYESVVLDPEGNYIEITS